jgi:CheY-like chemotaxis protein
MSTGSGAAAIGGPNRPEGLCVLLAEDDEGDAYLIGRALADNRGVGRVVRAKDGVEALTMIERGEVAPDVAFIDLQMPLMNGFDLLVALTESARGAFPMVVLTSSAARNDAIKSRLRNATRVVSKPDTVTELFAVLAAAIEAVCPASGKQIAATPHKAPEYLYSQPAPRGLRLRATKREGDA